MAGSEAGLSNESKKQGSAEETEMAFDYKKEYSAFYLPENKPAIVTIPKMNDIAVRGRGDPNDESGEYANAMSLLYGIAYTIKTSHKGAHNLLFAAIMFVLGLTVAFIISRRHQKKKDGSGPGSEDSKR
jgi:hypothetical protein